MEDVERGELVQVGMLGDMALGARPIGMDSAMPFGKEGLDYALLQNPTAFRFTLQVNPFMVDRAKRLIDTLNDRGMLDAQINVVSGEKLPRDAWLIEPSV